MFTKTLGPLKAEIKCRYMFGRLNQTRHVLILTVLPGGSSKQILRLAKKTKARLDYRGFLVFFNN